MYYQVSTKTSLEIDKKEKDLLKNLKKGFNKIKIYKSKDDITVVTFVLNDNSLVTINTRDEIVDDRFEVIPISVSDTLISSKPFKTLELNGFNNIKSINVLLNTEWSIPSSDEGKRQMLGNTENATTQFCGLRSEIPANSLNHATFHAGIEILNEGGVVFGVVSASKQLYSLAVSCEESNEQFIVENYERILLC